ncbi:MAG: ECF transporter S component [Clostridia bacterium]|nr:ECF transporter S component [Clostridia bacterium]
MEKVVSRRIATLKLTYAAMLASIAVLFPQLFHLTGIPNAGQILLPMHIPVLICGLWLGPYYGGAVGALAPFLSCLLTQMPTVARMPFMVIELAAYGVICGVLYKGVRLDRFRFGIYPALIGGMLGGRVMYALALTVATYLLKLEAGTAIAVVSATVTGIVGITVQIVFVPLLVFSLERITRFSK